MSTQLSTPRVLATAIVNKTSVNTPIFLATVVKSDEKSYFFDSKLNIQADIVKHCDTSLEIASNAEKYTKYFDTVATIQTYVLKHADTVLEIGAGSQGYTKYFDSNISIQADIIKHFDTAIDDNTKTSIIKYFDTKTSIPHDTSIDQVITPTNPFKPAAENETPGATAITLNLQALTLSDSFNLETTQDINVLDKITGHILDFDYIFTVDETSQRDKIISAQGMYDVDEILHQSITYDLGSTTHTLREHSEAIAAALGKKLYYAGDNFTHSGTWIGEGQTYDSIISSLFGWSSSIPNKSINVFMRAKDNSLNVVQRGHEQNSIDITDTAHTRPLIQRSLERTMINYSNKDGASNSDSSGLYIEPLPFWGTLTFGDAVCSYESGYLTSEHVNGDIISYSYTGDGFGTGKYLSHKQINHADGSITSIRYEYYKTKTGVMILGSETEITTDTNGNETVRKTIHAPLGNGFFGTSVYIDGEFQGSSIGTGSPAATASRFLRNQESITLGGARYGESNNNPLGTGNRLKETIDIPTTDETTLNYYLNELKSLNRRIKEVITMDIYNYDHVVDFTDAITFKGNNYYLDSNTISQTPTELKQSVQLVRWF